LVGADRLRVIATVSDGLGNTGTRTHEIEVIDPLALVVAPEARPFKTGLPDIGDAWFAEGRGLYDIDGGLRTLLERPVDAIDYLGDRLVLALNDIGIVVIDPADKYRVLSQKPVLGEISDLTISDDRLLAVIDGEVHGFTISGNAVEHQAIVTVNGKVLDLQARAGRFLVLTDAGLLVLDKEFGVAHRVDGKFTAQARDHLFIVAGDGRLHVLRADFSEQRFAIDVMADRLLVLQGDLLALSASRIQVIDIRNPAQPEKIGSFSVPLGGDVTRAFLAGGRLWAGGSRALPEQAAPGPYP
jgi:hypothetical protein